MATEVENTVSQCIANHHRTSNAPLVKVENLTVQIDNTSMDELKSVNASLKWEIEFLEREKNRLIDRVAVADRELKIAQTVMSEDRKNIATVLDVANGIQEALNAGYTVPDGFTRLSTAVRGLGVQLPAVAAPRLRVTGEKSFSVDELRADKRNGESPEERPYVGWSEG